MEFTIKLDAPPALCGAINSLAMLLEATLRAQTDKPVSAQTTAAPNPLPVQPVAPTQVVPQPFPQEPIATSIPTAPQPAPTVAPSVTPTSAAVPQPVPTSSAPTYTQAQLSLAGSSLMDAGKMQDLLALLTKYGVQAVTQLQESQYGAFATDLRALGAKI